MKADAYVKNAPEITEDEVLAPLRRFTRPRPQAERCDLCGTGLGPDHGHLLQRETQQVVCCCNACAVLFCGQDGGRYLRIPRRIRQLTDFDFDDTEWEAMMLPIHLAFFLRDGDRRIAAMYPSPAGVVRSQLGMTALEGRFANHHLLSSIEPEVEALLVNRGANGICFLVPIDECYRLVGLMRMKWRGLSGGAEVWNSIDEFFQELTRRSDVRGSHA
jgi:hypothetical protein